MKNLSQFEVEQVAGGDTLPPPDSMPSPILDPLLLLPSDPPPRLPVIHQAT